MAAQLFVSTRMLLPDGLQEAGIVVCDGKIVNVLRGSEALQAFSRTNMEVEDFGDLVVMAGIVDSHVHVNEPGRTAWEGYETATRAAAAGGVTTIVDMPLNSIPPTTTVANLATKLESAKGKLQIDVAFWGGVVPGNQASLRSMVALGVVGFKCFLCPSGVDEFPHVTRDDVEVALRELQGTDSVLAFHAECELEEGSGAQASKGGNPEKYKTFLDSRRPQMEEDAVRLVAELCTKYGVRCHIVHLSAAETLPIVQATKSAGAKLTAETCFHYLTLSAEEVPDQAVEYKCCPPVRGTQNKERLWSALAAGDIDMVVSDHSPCTPELKHPGDCSDFMRAWGGISSLQFGLPLLWTEGRKRGFTVDDVTRLMSVNTASLAGLGDRKGRLDVGWDADLVVWDPEKTFKVEASMIQHKHKLTPYLGRELQGLVSKTVVRGDTVFRLGEQFPVPTGQAIFKTTS